MRRSWFARIVVPGLVGIALSGCATNQKRLVSTPEPQLEAQQPSDSGRRLFSWQWWSKPKADPVMAQQDVPIEPEIAPSSNHREGAAVSPWPAPKSDRLTRYFPALGRRTPANPQNTPPGITAPTARRDGSSRDGGVRQANADLDDAESIRVANSRRAADDPPLLPAPLSIPIREHNRPAPPVQGGVDLSVSGASENLNDSARNDARTIEPTTTLLDTHEPVAGADPSLMGPPKIAQNPKGRAVDTNGQESVKSTEIVKGLPTPLMPNPSLPATEIAGEKTEIVPEFAPSDWPATTEPQPSLDAATSTVVSKDEPLPTSPKAESKPLTSPKAESKPATDSPSVALAGKDETSSAVPPAPKVPETRKNAGLDAAAQAPSSPGPLSMPERPDPNIQVNPGPTVPSWTPTSQFVPVPDVASGQSQSYFGGYGSPQQAAQPASEGHVWGLGLFSGKLLPCLKKKFHHKEATKAVYASAQSMFPPTYYACEQKAPVTLPAPQKALPAPQKTLPAPQTALPSPQASVLVAKKKCEWLEKCKLIQAVKDWKARCKIKMCPCCSGGHNSAKCVTATGYASPQASAPVSSSQTYADIANPSAPISTRPESRDLTQRRDIVQRVSTDSVGETSER